MTLGDVTSRDAVFAAVTEFDQLGRLGFLEKYGFGKARSYFLVHEGGHYDSKAIVGSAHGHQYPDRGPLTHDTFSGGEQTVAALLRGLGFEVLQVPGRNPDWTRGELLLALDLYLREGQCGRGHPEVIELSKLLNTLPVHSPATRRSDFRNPNGVARKLANFVNFDPSYAGKPTRGSQLDGVVYAEWADKPNELHDVANAIRTASQTGGLSPNPEDDEEEVEAIEGRLLYRRHRVRERDARLRKRKIDSALKAFGKLSCEVYGFDFAAFYGERGEGYIECHHIRPLHSTQESTTRLADLALVCANCHRVIHRSPPWPSPAELRAELKPR